MASMIRRFSFCSSTTRILLFGLSSSCFGKCWWARIASPLSTGIGGLRTFLISTVANSVPYSPVIHPHLPDIVSELHHSNPATRIDSSSIWPCFSISPSISGSTTDPRSRSTFCSIFFSFDCVQLDAWFCTSESGLAAAPDFQRISYFRMLFCSSVHESRIARDWLFVLFLLKLQDL